MLLHLLLLAAAASVHGQAVLQAGLSASGTFDAPKKYPSKLTDLVAAFPADPAHLPIAKASRHWRKGMRAVIATSEQRTKDWGLWHHYDAETWVHYPDDNPKRSLYAGDTRAALVPFLAHKALSGAGRKPYKWLLYGDDDTVWFTGALLPVLERLDPDMPYFISDHMWWSAIRGQHVHPSRTAPRCLPCNYSDAGIDRSQAPFDAPKGCPCTAELLCRTDTQGAFNAACDIPRAADRVYSIHGGAGAILSVGMLRAVPLSFMEECVKSLQSTGGDAFIHECLWKAGYASTDPGPGFFDPDIQMMDPGPEDVVGTLRNLLLAMDQNCDRLCQKKLDNTLTLHMRSRVFPSLQDAAETMKVVALLHDSYMRPDKKRRRCGWRKRGNADAYVERVAELRARFDSLYRAGESNVSELVNAGSQIPNRIKPRCLMNGSG